MAASAIGTRRNRVGGSSYTVFTWQNTIIGSARQITYTSPAPVADVVPIHPLDSVRPTQIITPAAISMGEMQLEIYELYQEKVWNTLTSGSSFELTGLVDLADVFRVVASSTTPIVIAKVIHPPAGAGVKDPWTEQYHNVVISSVDDGETIEIGTMQVLKKVNVAFTHITNPDLTS